MSRFVTPRRPGPAGGKSEDGDDFKARLAKYIPAEILTLYTGAVGGVISSRPDAGISPWIASGLIALFVAATFAYVRFKAPRGVVRKAHFVASPVSFLAMAYPIAAPLLGVWFIGWLAIVGQAVAALVAWLIEPEEIEEDKTKTAGA